MRSRVTLLIFVTAHSTLGSVEDISSVLVSANPDLSSFMICSLHLTHSLFIFLFLYNYAYNYACSASHYASKPLNFEL